jgi:hypothetical protein
MNIKTCGINDYLGAVSKKLNAPATTRILTFGTKKAVAGQPMVRDAEGLLTTKAGILENAQTQFGLTAGRDEFAVRMANFSVGNNAPSTGYEAVANVKTVGAIDLTILARAQSIIPFVAVDRAMKNQVDTLFYMDLVALEDTDDVAAGEVIDGNFQAPNSKVKVDFTRESTAADKWVAGEANTEFAGIPTYSAGCELVPGTVKVTVTKKEGSKTYEFIGRDFNGDGYVLFKSGVVTDAIVDYDAGKIGVKVADGYEIAGVTYAVDNQASNEGKQTLKVAP